MLSKTSEVDLTISSTQVVMDSDSLQDPQTLSLRASSAGHSFIGRGVRLGVIGAILLVLAGTSVWLVSIQSDNAGATWGIWVPPDHLDFGTVWAQPSFPWKLRLENRSPDDITVLDALDATSCNCAAFEFTPKPLTIAQGETADLEFRLNLLSNGLDEDAHVTAMSRYRFL